jgi:hypothetical protein
MAKKLIDQDEAARLLGVSVDELNSMRDRKQVFPKRDAGVWKYELDQIELLAQERKSGGDLGWNESLELHDLSIDLNAEPDSVVLADDGSKVRDEHSTVVGKKKPPELGSDVKLMADSGASDVKLAPDSKVARDRAKSGSGLLDDIAAGPGESDKLLGSGSLKLADDEINLTGSESDRRRMTSGSDTRKGESALELAADDELVLESKPDSDITVGGGDSGISLVDPHDSGLSLEQPLELEAASAESFDLGEDDIISLDEEASSEESTELKSDDDFLLTPIDDAADESDSGSQVIALDSEEEFSGGFGSSPALLEEDLSASGPLVAPGLAPAASLAAGATAVPTSYVAEPPYSFANIAALVACFVFMLLGGAFMYDLVRQMWSWDAPYALNNAMMDSLSQYLP